MAGLTSVDAVGTPGISFSSALTTCPATASSAYSGVNEEAETTY
jgi:hypothetical protein